MSESSAESTELVLLVADGLSPGVLEHARYLAADGTDVAILRLGSESGDPRCDGSVATADAEMLLADVSGEVSVRSLSDADEANVAGALERLARRPSAIVVYLTDSQPASIQMLAAAIPRKALVLAQAIAVVACAAPLMAAHCTVLFVLSPSSVFHDSGNLSDAVLHGGLLSLVPALATELPALNVNGAVLWNIASSTGDGTLGRRSSMTLSWLSSPAVAVSGFVFHVCGGHVSRLVVGDSRGYTVPHDPSKQMLANHQRDIVSEDGFMVYSSLTEARDVMNLRLITAGSEPGIHGPVEDVR